MFTPEPEKTQNSLIGRFNLWFWLLVAAVFLLSGLAIAKGAMQVVAAQDELKAIQAVNQRLKARNEVLYQKVMRLKQDPGALEKACRDDLYLVSPNEVVYLESGASPKPLADKLVLGDSP